MNTAAEISLLRECAVKLGTDSYLGPWILEVIPEVEHMIRCDIFPDISVGEARARAEEIVAQARRTAEEITQAAALQAKRTHEYAASTVDEAKRLLTSVTKVSETAQSSLEAYSKRTLGKV